MGRDTVPERLARIEEALSGLKDEIRRSNADLRAALERAFDAMAEQARASRQCREDVLGRIERVKREAGTVNARLTFLLAVLAALGGFGLNVLVELIVRGAG